MSTSAPREPVPSPARPEAVSVAAPARPRGWPRRALNVAVALVMLLLTLPLWVLIAVAIKLTSPGPVFYTQTRVGLDRRRGMPPPPSTRRRVDYGGRPFTILKFRTMRVDAENGTGAVWATEDDPRVTPLGRLLRDYRLDELPQLLNVLRGDMNVVGPRPERPTIATEMRRWIPSYPDRHQVLPGITGHAQINLEYDSTIDTVRQKVEYDLEYVDKAGFWHDLAIMLKTIPVMLFRRGSR